MDDPAGDFENLALAVELLRSEADVMEHVAGPNAVSLVLRRQADRLETPLLDRYAPQISAWLFNLGPRRA